MLGIVLLYVGAVLCINGISALGKIDGKSAAIMNLLTGGLGLILNIVLAVHATTPAQYYAVATGLLFAFTYLYVAATNWYELDGSGLGWYCLYVAITTLPCALLSYLGGDIRFTVIWLAWGYLWFLFWLALSAKKDLGKLLPYSTIAIGIITAWIPGYLLLINRW